MDILTGCIGYIAVEIGKCIVNPITRHVGYLFNFKKIIDDLTKAKKDLQLEQQKVKEAIERAAMNTEVVENDVKGWLENVNQLMEEVHSLENIAQVNTRFCNGWSPNWIWRYKLCKEPYRRQLLLKCSKRRETFPKWPIALQFLA